MKNSYGRKNKKNSKIRKTAKRAKNSKVFLLKNKKKIKINLRKREKQASKKRVSAFKLIIRKDFTKKFKTAKKALDSLRTKTNSILKCNSLVITFKVIKGFTKTLEISLIIIFTVLAFSGIFASASYYYFAKDISDPNRLVNRKNTGTIIYDRNGEIIYEAFGAKYRELLELGAMPKYIKDATIASEDEEFYSHSGVSRKGILRAIYKNIETRSISQGGSSITQQLVKNTLLNPDRNLIRKYQEVLLALEIERRYKKDDILKMYLNEIYYGEGAWGIQDAAKVFFGKEAKDLDLAESAMLSGLPAAPTAYSPFLNPDDAKKRQKYVLDRMEKLGMITKEESEAAFTKQLSLMGQKTEIKAPHFVMAVLEDLRKEYGNEFVEKGGLRVYTTLDMKKQKVAENAVIEEMDKLKGKNVSNAALVSADPKTGEILAYVGSIDWSNSEWGKVDIADTFQQPGSAFKPFAYITALEKGWTTVTTIKDEPVSFPDGTLSYVPKNYDGKFHGNVTVRRALANSLNVPAIKTLQFAGVDDTINTAKTAGITTLDQSKYKYGLSLVLGGCDVHLTDMVSAYGTLANGGVYVKPVFVSKVIDKTNKVITKPKEAVSRKRVFDNAYTFLITSILSDEDARREVFGPNSPLKLSRPAAAKTGTTNEYRDGWTMGYTPNLVTGVWIGNNDNIPMLELPGALGAGYVWKNYMEKALNDMPVEEFKKPDNIVEKFVRSDGRIVSAGSSGAKLEYFVAGTEPKDKEIVPVPKDYTPKNEEPVVTAPIKIEPVIAPVVSPNPQPSEPTPLPVEKPPVVISPTPTPPPKKENPEPTPVVPEPISPNNPSR
ncbi:MAG: PBP1A family penicillin-binding protein [Patescibacteria group bacterium]|nr:PBP1A family penicillin-binding protein [Patescibacteria group bacterium]